MLRVTSKAEAPDVLYYITCYGGNCRDCADDGPICPSSGLPCATRDCYAVIRRALKGDTTVSEKASEHVRKAVEYGLKHGYLEDTPANHEKKEQ